jgi:hypothetical protein
MAAAALEPSSHRAYTRAMDLSHVFSRKRWSERFRSEEEVQREALRAGREPDATVDEVGASPPIGRTGNGQGSGDPSSPGWAGWSGGGGGF